MPNGNDWTNLNKKRAAILRVLRYIVANPQAGQACVGNDAAARALFEDPQIGNITVPAGARVLMFPAGEESLREASSVVLELPPAGEASPGDAALLGHVLGNYKYW